MIISARIDDIVQAANVSERFGVRFPPPPPPSALPFFVVVVAAAAARTHRMMGVGMRTRSTRTSCSIC